jgi:hypothetical protein
MKRFFGKFVESWWLAPVCFAAAAAVQVPLSSWCFDRAWEAAWKAGAPSERWTAIMNGACIGFAVLMLFFAVLAVVAVVWAAVRRKWGRVWAGVGACVAALGIAFGAVCAGLSWGFEVRKIEGEYGGKEPSFEEIEQDWSVIYYEIIPHWGSPDWRRRLRPLPGGCFLLAIEGGSGHGIETEYRDRKAKGIPPGSYPYNADLWTEWNPSEEAVEVRSRTGHWPEKVSREGGLAPQEENPAQT